MQVRAIGFVTAAVVTLASQTATACHVCHRTPCVLPPAPAYQCVTEMVPYTVMKPQTRVEFRPVTETVMVRVPETTWHERQRWVCKPVFETSAVQRRVVACRPVFDTTYVNQCYTVCRPVATTRQVTEYCMQPTTRLVSVVAGHKCGLCGGARNACGCQTVALTCYTPVPVTRDVVVTQYVPEVQTRQVPVTTCRLVPEERIETIPVTRCRLVRELVTERIPCTTFRCVPQTVTRQIPYPVCEVVPVTCYRPVTRMVPCAPPAAPAAYYAAPQVLPAPSGQASPSRQG